jgi:hypothetical protein
MVKVTSKCLAVQREGFGSRQKVNEEDKAIPHLFRFHSDRS